MHSLRWIIIFLGLASISWAATITCTITDQSGAVISSSCSSDHFGYSEEVAAVGSPQFWSVYASGSAYVDVYWPDRGSISISDYASFSVPMVVLGGTGSGYLWYHATTYRASHYGQGYLIGSLSVGGSVPCDVSASTDAQYSGDCYFPFTYGVPLTLSGSAGIGGTITGGILSDGGYYRATGTLMGIVSDPGSHSLIAQDVTIEAMPEPTMLPPLGLAAFFLVCRRLSHFRNQRADR